MDCWNGPRREGGRHQTLTAGPARFFASGGAKLAPECNEILPEPE